MSTSSYTEFNLPRNAYAAFDAISLKQLITNRLKESGLFPDIDYEGSNINGLTDVLAYTYHVLLFYLNQTASDSLFSQAELFENMNKIVSLIGYKVNGNNTSSLNVSVSADATLSPNSYTIKRFSNISVANVAYSFNKDITFQKTTTSGNEYIESIGKENILYQGVFREYPTYTAIGENFEQFTLNVDYVNDSTSDKMVDNNNIFVFVKDINTQKWTEWKEISNLYLANNNSLVFEKRFNEYHHHEIKFGNDVNGKKLNTGDSVVIFYLESDGRRGMVGSKTIGGGKLVPYTSLIFEEIYDDIKQENANYLDSEGYFSLQFDNQYASIPYNYVQDVDSIRKNAPYVFSAQNRAVTVYDYESIINKNFSNILRSVKVLSNKEYTSQYLSYFYDLGLERPNLDDKLLFNQVSFSDACDFNNVYVFCVPSIGAIQNETDPIELFYNQKQSIIDKLSEMKMINHNIVISDPIYFAFELGLPITNETLDITIKDETKIRITRNVNDIVSKEQIKNEVFRLIKSFFSQENNELGQVLDLNKLSFDILNINGVKTLETIRTNNGIEYKSNKLNFIYWNPLYPSVNVQYTAQNLNMESFQFPYFYEISKLINKIEVV
jgi:hypothetical protein